MSKILLPYLLILIPQFLSAQNTTALAEMKAATQKAQDYALKNLDSALFFGNKALVIAQKLDSPRLIYKIQRTIGLIYEDNKRLEDAKKTYKKALDIANNQLGSEEQLTIYTDWAIIHKKMRQYDTAEIYHRMTIEKAEKLGKWAMAEDGYHGLGTLYSMLSDFNKSIQMYHKSVEAAEKWGNQEGVVLSNQNISNIYMKAKNYDMALKNIEKTYQMALELGDSVRIAAVLKIYGNIHTAMGDFSAALDKHLKAKTIIEKRGDKIRLSETHLALGDIQFNLRNYPEAQAHFDTCKSLSAFLAVYGVADLYQKQGKLYQNQDKIEEAIAAFYESLKITDSFGFKDLARDNHLALASIFADKKQFSEAYVHSVAANQLSVDLFEEKNQKNMTEAQFKFEEEKRDLSIKTQEKELKQAAFLRKIMLGGLLILLGLLAFTWRQMREKHKANARTEFIIRELHHRVKNNMQTVASMMRLQARESTDPSVSAVLLENKTRLETFSMLHQQLYLNERVETLDLQPFVTSMLEKLRLLYNLQNDDKLTTHLVVKTPELNTDIALSIGLILNELLTNSFKYATPSVLPLVVSIKICPNHFIYTDNGNTLPTDFDFQKHEGFGIQLIEHFAEQIKAKYKFSVDNGLRFTMDF